MKIEVNNPKRNFYSSNINIICIFYCCIIYKTTYMDKPN